MKRVLFLRLKISKFGICILWNFKFDEPQLMKYYLYTWFFWHQSWKWHFSGLIINFNYVGFRKIIIYQQFYYINWNKLMHSFKVVPINHCSLILIVWIARAIFSTLFKVPISWFQKIEQDRNELNMDYINMENV